MDLIADSIWFASSPSFAPWSTVRRDEAVDHSPMYADALCIEAMQANRAACP
jgi:hypothetical protein